MFNSNGGLIGDGLEHLDPFAGEHAYCFTPHHHRDRKQGAQPFLLGQIQIRILTGMLLSSKTSGAVNFWREIIVFLQPADYLLKVLRFLIQN